MRPVRLELRAFLAFADRVVLDFRALGAHELFVISGPTGSGKTSLLDAICFALYGSAGRPVETLFTDHRDHAPTPQPAGRAGAAPYVELVFQLGERCYRVRRTPPFLRKKKRGSGEAVEKPTATLWRLASPDDPRGREVVSGFNQVTDEITGLLRFKAHEFRQVVLLPQGRFQEVLLASAPRREELLKTLFETHRFERAQQLLTASRRKLEETLGQLEAVHEMLVRATGCTGLGAYLERGAALAAEHRRAVGEREQATRRLTRLVRYRDQARDLAARFREQGDLERRLSALLGREQEMLALEDRLERARRAETVRDLAVAARRAREAEAEAHRALAAARNEEERASAAAASAASALAQAEEDAASLEPLRRERDRLRTLAPRLAERDAAREEVVRLKAARERARADLARHKAASASLAEERAALEERLQRARLAAELARRLAALAGERDEAVARRLALALRPGEPCPVCGATEHPAAAAAAHGDATEPAAAGSAATDPAAADRALARLQAEATALAAKTARAAAELERAGAEHAAQETALVRAEARLEQLVAALAEAGQSETTARGLAERQSQLERELAGHERALEAARQAQLAARESWAAARARLAACEAELARAAEAAAGTVRELAERLSEVGFASLEEAQASALPRAEQARLAEERARHARDLGATRVRLAELSRVLEGRRRPDLPRWEAHTAEAEAAAGQALAREVRLETELAAHERRRAVEGLVEKRERVMAELGTVGTLARNLAGDNPARLSLQRFVLAARLEEVALAASERLGQMSRGRYRLRHSTEQRDRRELAGLNLVIDDAYTGRTRPVETLSGGECFMASLALALGLADVVQRRSGGIPIEALFIDEGFGSLDEEALDEVLRALNEVRGSGRLVGLVSHVAELKRQIGATLQVSSTTHGSTARFVIAA